MQTPVHKELTLNYSIGTIKSKLDEMTKVYTNYIPHDKNDVFNTYTIALTKGLTAGILNITLTKIDDSSTLWVSQMMPASGSNTSSATLSGIQDEFMRDLSNFLTGKTNAETVRKAQGCLVVIFALAASAMCALIFIA